MEARHEIIPFDGDSPIRLYMHKLGDVSRHWHESLELLFVLSGEVEVVAGEGSRTLRSDDMLLINSNVIHELHSEECVMIAVQIKLSRFNLPSGVTQSLYFDCDSQSDPENPAFLSIKRILANTLRTSAVGGEATLFHRRALAYSLLAELVQSFKVSKPAGATVTQKHLERLSSILSYLSSHYREQITLNQIAEREHLSVPYLSSFFERHMGINFTAYYTNLRLEHAVRELLYTDIPVEQIALNSGFSDPRSFVRAFKKKYNRVPSAYRKDGGSADRRAEDAAAINYLDFTPENYLHILSSHIQTVSPIGAVEQRKNVRTAEPLEIDARAEGRPLRHTWRTFVGVGRASDLLKAEIQEMLRELQKNVGFRYVRFHGILCDDLLVCQRAKDGSLRISFALAEKVLDFILSIGLKPLIQFSFMPAALAEDPSRTVFAAPMVTSPPASMEEWNLLIAHFMGHIRLRYGSDEIRTWLFSVWNEPETSEALFGFADPNRYFELYENTYRTVKGTDPALVFGSPSIYPARPVDYRWVEDYLNFTRAHGCMPEFMDLHYYADEFETVGAGMATFTTPAHANADPDHFAKYLSGAEKFMEQHGVGHLPLYITEWNLTVSHRNLINDTCFKATYLVKNFLENYDRPDAIGYWSLTDQISELQPDSHLFHGGMGLFTQDGIKKPCCLAMEMMRRLGDELLAQGNGYFVTRRPDGLALVLYNYRHYNPLFVDEGFGLTMTERDGVFPDQEAVELTVSVAGLTDGLYRIRETVLNRENGSCFDLWVKMGAGDLGRMEEEWLKQASHPAMFVRQAPVIRDRLTHTVMLEPFEVRLVEIVPLGGGYQ